MNHGPSTVLSEDLAEPLDIDIDTLDHALMELLTSDWQALEGDGSTGQADRPDERPASDRPHRVRR